METTPNDLSARKPIQDAYTHMKEATNSLRDAARTAGSDVQDAARVQYSKGRESAEAMAMRAEERIKERPLAAIGVAFAAGWLISRMMR